MSDRDALRDEIELRWDSIHDARSELDADEMTAQQFAAIEARELTAIERAQRALDALEASGPPPRAPRPRRRHRRGLLVVSLVAFTMAMAGAVVLAAQPRQPGSSETGSISGSVAQQVARLLGQAEIDQAIGNDVNALIAYNEVLALEPKNSEALAQSGWLYFTAGSAGHDVGSVRLGVSRLARAVRLAPTDPSARLYYAIAAASTPGSRAVAIAQMRIFLALHPSAHLLAIARPWLRSLGLSAG
jgi:hypothetical protein